MTFSTNDRRSRRLPSWLKRKIPLLDECSDVERVIRKKGLHTICREGRCPNRAECYSKNKVTFLILGDICTRNCLFCDVKNGQPGAPDLSEADRIVEAVQQLGLTHVIITSVTRDDLPDGGSRFYSNVVRKLKELDPPPLIELLIPDFNGNTDDLRTVLDSNPDIISHNIETVRTVFRSVRKGADYDRSISILSTVKNWRREVMTKSALMLGLGESVDEVLETMTELREAECDFLAIGQYLRPGIKQIPVEEFIHPEKFLWYEKKGYEMGFLEVTAGPLVRSSYQENKISRFRKSAVVEPDE
ncbi:MAG TPA: lipoyl synthase [Candidatus Krumholzibacteriaceae bacterium]|nr:lipoyl synthase [Candidatus Krumholzibacteriaceae bacterium]